MCQDMSVFQPVGYEQCPGDLSLSINSVVSLLESKEKSLIVRAAQVAFALTSFSVEIDDDGCPSDSIHESEPTTFSVKVMDLDELG